MITDGAEHVKLAAADRCGEDGIKNLEKIGEIHSSMQFTCMDERSSNTSALSEILGRNEFGSLNNGHNQIP
jgi:hypothetical protein